MSSMLKQKLIDIANGFTKYGLWKGGTEITVDSELSTTSTNPVQNKVVTGEINKLNNNLNDKNQVSFNTFTVITNVNGDISIVKKGNVATLCLTFNQFTVPNGAWNAIATIPEGFRPALWVRDQRTCKADKTNFEFAINPGNGKFLLRNSENNDETIYGLLYFTCSYVCS